MDRLKELRHELLAMITELEEQDAEHISANHESEAARTSDPTFSYCPGCRLNVATSIYSDLHTYRDDTRIQKRLGNKSQRDVHIEVAQRWLQAASRGT